MHAWKRKKTTSWIHTRPRSAFKVPSLCCLVNSLLSIGGWEQRFASSPYTARGPEIKCEFNVKQTDHRRVENPPVDMQNGYIILKVFHRTGVRRFFPGVQAEEKRNHRVAGTPTDMSMHLHSAWLRLQSQTVRWWLIRGSNFMFLSPPAHRRAHGRSDNEISPNLF